MENQDKQLQLGANGIHGSPRNLGDWVEKLQRAGTSENIRNQASTRELGNMALVGIQELQERHLRAPGAQVRLNSKLTA